MYQRNEGNASCLKYRNKASEGENYGMESGI